MYKSSDDKWLDVLSGKSNSSDSDTASAQILREYFSKRESVEMLEITDSVREAALLKRLRASAITRTGRFTEDMPKSGFVRWLTAVFSNKGAVGFAFAGMLVAVVVIPELTDPEAPDDQVVWKNLTSQSGKVLMLVEDPTKAAADLSRAIQSAGFQPNIMRRENQFWIEVAISDSVQRKALQGALLQYGLVVPTNGYMRIWIKNP